MEYSQTAQHKLSKLADLQIENNQLRDTLKDYNEELKDVKSQGKFGACLASRTLFVCFLARLVLDTVVVKGPGPPSI